MGGGGVEYTVPNYKKFDNWRQYPELAAHQDRLKRMGLKDPWVRNYAHCFAGSGAYGYMFALKRTLFRGFWSGVAACAVLIAIDEGYLKAKYGYTSWSKPEHH